jgi:hypothetical protein
MYKVIKAFIDSADGYKQYAAGEDYPRHAYEPEKERVAQLKKAKLIAEDADDKKIKEDTEK